MSRVKEQINKYFDEAVDNIELNMSIGMEPDDIEASNIVFFGCIPDKKLIIIDHNSIIYAFKKSKKPENASVIFDEDIGLKNRVMLLSSTKDIEESIRSSSLYIQYGGEYGMLTEMPREFKLIHYICLGMYDSYFNQFEKFTLENIQIPIQNVEETKEICKDMILSNLECEIVNNIVSDNYDEFKINDYTVLDDIVENKIKENNKLVNKVNMYVDSLINVINDTDLSDFIKEI